MKEKESHYRCPVCSLTIKGKAGEKHICPFCLKLMKEASKGIITKSAGVEIG